MLMHTDDTLQFTAMVVNLMNIYKNVDVWTTTEGKHVL